MTKKQRKPVPMWPEDGKDYVIGYMCLIAFECELGACDGGITIYPSKKSLLRAHNCVKDCGIAKVRVKGISVIRETSDKYYK